MWNQSKLNNKKNITGVHFKSLLLTLNEIQRLSLHLFTGPILIVTFSSKNRLNFWSKWKTDKSVPFVSLFPRNSASSIFVSQKCLINPVEHLRWSYFRKKTSILDVNNNSWRRVNKNSLFWWYTLKTSWRRLANVLKMSWGRLKDATL